jgi:hypothetical protein
MTSAHATSRLPIAAVRLSRLASGAPRASKRANAPVALPRVPTNVHAFGFCVWTPGGINCNHDPVDRAQVELCRLWLRMYGTHTASINHRISSYGLKHRVTAALKYRVTSAHGAYVTNGAFIVAARLEGYRVERQQNGGPNALFNIYVKRRPRDLRDLDFTDLVQP